MNRPQPEEFASFYQGYIDLVSDDVIGELEDQATSFPTFVRSLPPEKMEYAYAPGKWTIKQIVGHLIDNERILAYRLLCLSRKDPTPLPGYDQNEYIAKSYYRTKDTETILKEFEAVRRANLFLYKSLQPTDLDYIGTANNHPISAKALLFVIAGHLNHHRKIIGERYL